MKMPRWSVNQLSTDLRRLGVVEGELLMVHASLRAVGPTEGGADGLLAALATAIGPAGTLLVNVGVRDDHAWVNERPEHERASLLRDALPFDHVLTPADPDNGVLAEVFRTRPGTVVSNHPEGRFAAAGPLAERLVSDVPWDDYYGADSPLERFASGGGHVLRLGANVDTLTLLHYAEHLVELPQKRRVRRHRLVSGPAGTELRVIETLDDSDGIAPYPGEDYFAVILRAYLAAGRAAIGTVGGATSELFDATDMIAFAVAWMAEHLRG